MKEPTNRSHPILVFRICQRECVCMYIYICIYVYIYIYISMCVYIYIYTECRPRLVSGDMGWLRLVGSITSQVSFAEYGLFYRALLQKRPIILSILLSEATPYCIMGYQYAEYVRESVYVCIYTYVYMCIYIYI